MGAAVLSMALLTLPFSRALWEPLGDGGGGAVIIMLASSVLALAVSIIAFERKEPRRNLSIIAIAISGAALLGGIIIFAHGIWSFAMGRW